jgi:photosystem II stability/assembly factor-like uncharacterized protein
MLPAKSEIQMIEGMVYGLTAASEQVVFAASEGGLYRSDDGGQTWHYAYEQLEVDAPPMTLSVAVSPDFATDHSVFAGAPGGVLRSSDGGHIWHIAGLVAPPPSISALVVSPNFQEDGTVWARWKTVCSARQIAAHTGQAGILVCWT